MTSTPRETFLSLPDEVLQGLAQAHGVDPTRYPNRDSLIEALASLPGAEDLVPEASRRRMAYQLDRLRPRQLRELGERHRVLLHGLKRKADLVEALAGAPDSSEILMELEAEAAPERDATLALGRESDVDFDRVEELLEQARKSFQERRFEAALTAAQEASRLAERTTEQLRRSSWSYGVLAAPGLLEPTHPADPEAAAGRVLPDREAQEHHEDAKAAVAASEHGRAGDLLKRAERLAMKGQQRQIDRAMQLRQAQIEKAQSVLGACEPILKEAESYDLSAAEVRTLLRQARDVLAKGDYLAGLTFAKNAEEASQLLEAQIADERRHRGIEKPASGICGVCRSRRVVFEDDGWGRCEDCGSTFRWRGPLGVWERLRALLAA